VDIANHPSPDRVRPILIRHGAFGLHRPHRDLVLSPDHAVFVDGVLIPARYLVDGDAIAPLPTSSVTYYHIELDRHDVVIAEGLAAESYLDTGDRASFAGLCQPDRTDADRCGLIREAQAYAELIVVGPLLQAVRSRVARYRSIRRVAATDRTCSALDR
jgi:hypothetical protein